MSKVRTYSEMCMRSTSFKDRFAYLKLSGMVGHETFGRDRYLNQRFYHSYEWRRVRDLVISRDFGCDLGVTGYDIPKGDAVIHHMNPMIISDLEDGLADILNPEYLITVSKATHNALHYGIDSEPENILLTRTAGDTCPWKEDIHGKYINRS